MLHQGKLKHWDTTQGCGFIQRDKAGPDICISSSDFRKKPDLLQDGDSIFFQIEVDAEGNSKAVLAYKAGQSFAPAPTLKKPTLSFLPFQQWLSGLVSLCILFWLVYQSVYFFSAEAASPAVAELTENADQHSAAAVLESPVWPPIEDQNSMQFQCEGKQHCSEMISCDEARFYLKNCPDVLIDGDQDGIPCEQQYCGRRRF